MGGCFTRIRCCSECCCYICCMGGVFYHMCEEGNLTCGIVRDCCTISTLVFAAEMIDGWLRKFKFENEYSILNM